MGANKFATMLQRSTNRMGVVLVYTVLEWILIGLLLLNGLFSYLIVRFADFFGLKPPCILCSRLDGLLEPDRGRGSYEGIICDDHAVEISRLGFCSNHRRLAEASEMCEDCSAPSWSGGAGDRTVALLSWMKRSEAGEKDLRCSCCDVSLESGFYSPYLLLKASWDIPEERVGEGCVAFEKDDEILEAEVLFPDVDDKVKEREEEGKELVGEHEEGEAGGLVVEQQREQEQEEEGESHLLSSNVNIFVEDCSLEVITMSLEAVPRVDRLLPVELIDSETMNKVTMVGSEMEKILASPPLKDDVDEELGVGEEELVDGNVCSRSISEKEMTLGLPMEIEDEVDTVTIGVGGSTEEDASVPQPVDDSTGDHPFEHECVVSQEAVAISHDGDNVVVESFGATEDFGKPQNIEVESLGATEDFGKPQNIEVESLGATEDFGKPQNIEVESLGATEDFGKPQNIEVESLGATEDFGKPQNIEVESHGATEDFCELQNVEVESFGVREDFAEPQGLEEDTKVVDADANCEVSIGSEICDHEQIEEAQLPEPIPLSRGIEDQFTESYTEQVNVEQVLETEQVETTAQPVNHLKICTELNEVEGERMPETPTTPIYIEGIHSLHKRFLFERREFGTESVDGSIASEIEGAEPLTVDHLKAALKAERKALSALYAELEEERSASAIAASQTMAMITRLQEEKAAMQMEALQYQRMMDEQSEYDQEALQLLNELMMKREKEKHELEKELEVYRKKVLLYESRERRKTTRGKASGRSGTSSASSIAEDSDDLSFDINGCDEDFDRLQEGNQNTPADAVLNSETDQETVKHFITLDESLADFEEERLAILDQLKALEEQLFTLDDEETSDNKEFAENLSEDSGHGMNGHYGSSGNDVNGLMNGLPDDIDTKEKLHSDRKGMGYKGKRLLPLFDAINMENEEELGINHEATDTSPDSFSRLALVQKKLAIAEEVDNVYGRLQALEADREFLKHCISSLKKGDRGMYLLQEILQHLRDLRAVELRVRNADDALASLST